MIYSNSHTHLLFNISLSLPSLLITTTKCCRNTSVKQKWAILTVLDSAKKTTNQLLFFILISDKYLKYLHLFEKNSVNNIRLRLPMNFMSILFKCSCWLLLKQWAVFLRPRDLLFSFSPKISRKNNEFSAYKNPFVVTQRFYPHWFFAW